MVSLITEKLRNQLLEDNVADVKQEQTSSVIESGASPQRRAIHTLSPHAPVDVSASAELQNDCGNGGSLLPTSNQRREETGFQFGQNLDALDKCQLCLSPAGNIPTKKRQCHMMSSPDENNQAQWRPGWQPQGTSVWRQVGLSAAYHGRSVAAAYPGAAKMSVSSPDSRGCSSEWISTETQRRRSDSSESPSPIQRPASASSGFLESSVGSLHVVGHRGSATRSPSLSQSAFSLSGLSLDEKRNSVQIVPSSAGSMPAIAGEDTGSGSLQCPQPQRCHSQPSVLLERRGIKKRRREEKRPNLNFIKMKETAYTKRHQGHSRTRGFVQFADSSNVQATKGESSIQSLRFFYSLDAIASSPQELVLDHAPVISPHNAGAQHKSPIHSDSSNKTYRESLDSGCSGDLVLCVELESPSHFYQTPEQLNEGIEEEEEVFDLDVLDELDIEKIEKD